MCHVTPTSSENSVGMCEFVHQGTKPVDVKVCYKKLQAWYDPNNSFPSFSWLSLVYKSNKIQPSAFPVAHHLHSHLRKERGSREKT